MPSRRIQAAIVESQRDVRAQTAQQFRRLRHDAGISARAVARAIGTDHSAILRFERGELALSVDTLAALGVVVGAPLQVSFRPGSGPLVRDRWQAARIEALLSIAHADWGRAVEVPVGRAAIGGGVIDCVLLNLLQALLVAVESEGEIRRIEQTLRWSAQKADALRYSDLGRRAGGAGRLRIERVLVLAATKHNRDVVASHESTFGAAYPGRLGDALAALEDPARRFPGSTLLWVTAGGGKVQIMRRPPNGISVGR